MAFAAALVAGLSVRVDCLVVRAPGGRPAAVLPLGAPVDRDWSFSLSFRHSVAKLPVEDFYRRSPGGMRLYRTVYQGLGAGLPFTDEEGTARLVDGAIVIDGLDREYRSFSVSPSSFTEHRLTVRGVRYDLYALVGGAIVTLAIDRRPLLVAILERRPKEGMAT